MPWTMPQLLYCVNFIVSYSIIFSFHSGIEPVQYEEKLRNSWVWQELKAVRYDHILHSLGTNYPVNIVMFSHPPSYFRVSILISNYQCWGTGAGFGSAWFWASRIRIHYSERHVSGSGSFYFLIKVLRGLK
jgi:hypothetical protein